MGKKNKNKAKKEKADATTDQAAEGENNAIEDQD